MRIENYQVSMQSQYFGLRTDSQTSSFVSNLKMNNDEINHVEKNHIQENKNILTSDMIIQELSRAIMRNLFILNQRGFMDDDFEFTYTEKEELSFQTEAFIQTSDKELHVNIDLNLQRSFTSKTTLSKQFRYFDPLVLSLDGLSPALSEKTFSFDIDSDGKSDQISTLAKNSAFLALDKNENGKIDNGNELFGTKSGNGFMDLKAYDKDGNNWIDENDEIFDKLRIWQKTSQGDKLLALGEAGIGAIFLGNTTTPYSLNTADNSPLGKMKSSGFFLNENGTSGIISQIDLAKQEEKSTLKDLFAIFDTNEEAIKADESKNSILNILTQRIKQMEVELIKADEKDKSILQEQILTLNGKLNNLQKFII